MYRGAILNRNGSLRGHFTFAIDHDMPDFILSFRLVSDGMPLTRLWVLVGMCGKRRR